jgi:hypothetical protein
MGERVNIIVRKGKDSETLCRDFAKSIKKGYYDKECQDGARFKSKFGKNATKKVWDDHERYGSKNDSLN